ncbi:hypothetical protein GCM10027294_45840 [Marinactinospora endophytica]
MEAESYVGVDGGGDADVGVAEEFLDDDGFVALLHEQGDDRVPESMEADATEAGVLEGHGAGGEGRPGDRPALRGDERVSAAPPLMVVLRGAFSTLGPSRPDRG